MNLLQKAEFFTDKLNGSMTTKTSLFVVQLADRLFAARYLMQFLESKASIYGAAPKYACVSIKMDERALIVQLQIERLFLKNTAMTHDFSDEFHSIELVSPESLGVWVAPDASNYPELQQYTVLDLEAVANWIDAIYQSAANDEGEYLDPDKLQGDSVVIEFDPTLLNKE